MYYETKSTTKKGERLLWAYERANACELGEVYGRCSWEKQRAFDRIKEYMLSVNGWGLRITGANCSFFSCAFLYRDADGVLKLDYYTGRNEYCVIIIENEDE